MVGWEDDRALRWSGGWVDQTAVGRGAVGDVEGLVVHARNIRNGQNCVWLWFQKALLVYDVLHDDVSLDGDLLTALIDRAVGVV